MLTRLHCSAASPFQSSPFYYIALYSTASMCPSFMSPACGSASFQSAHPFDIVWSKPPASKWLLFSVIPNQCQSFQISNFTKSLFHPIPISLLCFALLAHCPLCYAVLNNTYFRPSPNCFFFTLCMHLAICNLSLNECFALLCFALLCFALLCFALLCFALLFSKMSVSIVQFQALHPSNRIIAFSKLQLFRHFPFNSTQLNSTAAK